MIGNLRVNFFGSGCRPPDLHFDQGIGDIRKIVYRKAKQTVNAEHQKCCNNGTCCKPAIYCIFGDSHCRLPAASAGSSLKDGKYSISLTVSLLSVFASMTFWPSFSF